MKLMGHNYFPTVLVAGIYSVCTFTNNNTISNLETKFISLCWSISESFMSWRGKFLLEFAKAMSQIIYVLSSSRRNIKTFAGKVRDVNKKSMITKVSPTIAIIVIAVHTLSSFVWQCGGPTSAARISYIYALYHSREHYILSGFTINHV